uniref:DnaJ homolog subfamily C member 16 n=1 Tax=Parascaris equorum TaxID=6256 RepID=A0A914R3B3_PAREQ
MNGVVPEVRNCLLTLAGAWEDDKNAHTEFVRLNRAYEVLMDEEMRKKYDQFGEKGLSDDFQGGNQYQSWQFYHDNFGIYDEDAEIVTLSRADFQQEVIESGEMWFVNFYSSFCSHCHQLAPTASVFDSRYFSSCYIFLHVI